MSKKNKLIPHEEHLNFTNQSLQKEQFTAVRDWLRLQHIVRLSQKEQLLENRSPDDFEWKSCNELIPKSWK